MLRESLHAQTPLLRRYRAHSVDLGRQIKQALAVLRPTLVALIDMAHQVVLRCEICSAQPARERRKSVRLLLEHPQLPGRTRHKTRLQDRQALPLLRPCLGSHFLDRRGSSIGVCLGEQFSTARFPNCAIKLHGEISRQGPVLDLRIPDAVAAVSLRAMRAAELFTLLATLAALPQHRIPARHPPDSGAAAAGQPGRSIHEHARKTHGR